jgi:hypothetical protein
MHPRRESDHSPLSDSELKEGFELCLPNTPFWPGGQLKHGDHFTFLPSLDMLRLELIRFVVDLL